MIQIRHLIAHLSINLSERRTAEPLLASRQIHQQQHRFTRDIQNRRHRTTHIRHRCKCSHDKRQGRRHTETLSVVRPAAGHGHGILTDRDRNAQRWTQCKRNRLNRFKEIRILPRLTCCRHPVGTKMNVRQFADPRAGDVGYRLSDRHTATGRSIDECKRCPLAHRNGFTRMTIETRCRDTGIRNRHLPGPNHLVPHHLTPDTPVTDGHKKGFVGYGRQAQYPIHGVADRDSIEIKIRIRTRAADPFPMHPRCITKEQRHGKIHRYRVRVRVVRRLT